MKSFAPLTARLLRAALLSVGLAVLAQADVPTQLKPVGLGLGRYNYYSSGPFSNTMLTGTGWLEFAPNKFGDSVFFYNTDGTPNPQFNARGLPNYLNPGLSLRLLMWPYSVNPADAPATWPAKGGTGAGKWVITWKGDADVRLRNATFIAAESSGASSGALVDGRRVYLMDAANPKAEIIVPAVNTPLTDLKVWMPDPLDPTNQSLENSGSLWHSDFLANLSEMDSQFLRFMDWGATNASPVQDWSDRRPPDFALQTGVLNRRKPVTGSTGDRFTGIAYEHMVALANATNHDLWICVPHMATDAFVTNLANLIRYGSDGVNPYTSTQTAPVYPPLNANLKVWVEYSNEIWSSGYSFPQGNWAQEQADTLGITKPQFNARRFSQVWSIFQQQFGGSARIVRVAAIFTSSDSYTLPFLTELRDYGPTLSPAVEPDVVAPTTYFGNGIQDWVYEQANLTRGTADQWFLTDQDFVYNTTTGATRPVSVPVSASEPYWASPELAAQQSATFDEWRRRIFSQSTEEGGGPDATGTGGGFDSTRRDDILSIFGHRLPIVSYEGGPSLYTDYMDSRGESRDDGITAFINTLNRLSEFQDIYRIHLNMARSKGLATHGLFTDVGPFGASGQWGHREYPDQPFSEAVKWVAVSDWANDMAFIRDIDDPVGSVPSFVTPGTLPVGQYQTPYSHEIEVTGGDYLSGGAPHIEVIGSLMDPGLTLEPVAGDPWHYRVAGMPSQGGWNYFYLRVNDDDGDAAWQVYSFYIVGGPDMLIEADLGGAFAGASDLPKDDTLAISPSVSWSGLDIGEAYSQTGGSAIGTDGRGVNVFADTDGILFSVSQGTGTKADSTLASAITDNEYWKFTVTPNAGTVLNLRKAEFHLTWVRTDYHAPRNIAVMTSVGGFAEGDAIYLLPSMPAKGVVSDVVFTLPDSADYENLTAPVEFRLYFYGSQYAHKAELLGLKLSRDPDIESGYHLALESDFTGTNPGLSLPWTATSALAAGLDYSGWSKGAGMTGLAADDCLKVKMTFPNAEADATLDYSIEHNDYLSFILTPQSTPLNLRAADIQFTIQRSAWHSARRYAVFTSIGGFTSGAQLFDTGRFITTVPQTFAFQLPDTPAYQGLVGPVEVRIYPYSGQYAYPTALSAFSLNLFW